MKKFFIIASMLFLLFFSFGCISSQQSNGAENEITGNNSGQEVLQPTPLHVELTADDGMKLIGSMQQAKSSKGIIFLHQLNSTKQDYYSISKKFNSLGFNVLSVDFRGHGESISKNQSSFIWQNFSEKDFLDMEKDVKAAYLYFISLDVNEIYIVGASIGANTALNFAWDTEKAGRELKAVALLSPSFDYRGIKTLDSGKGISLPVFIACSKEDYSFNDCNSLSETIQSDEKEIRFIEGSRHGTQILQDEWVEKDLIEWIETTGNP